MQTALPSNRLGELIELRRLRPSVVAAHCNVDQSTVHRWKTGATAIPDGQKLRLAAFFDVTVPFLMGWPELHDAASNTTAASSDETERNAA